MIKKHLLFPIGLLLFEVAVYLSNDMYLPALPSISHTLNITMQQGQLTLTLWFLGSAAVQLILGPISNRYGRRPVLIGFTAIFILSCFLNGVISNYNLMLLLRFIQGSCVGAVFVAGYSVVHEKFDQKEAVSLIAWMSGITIIAPAFGPVAGSLVLSALHWRAIFFVLAILGALAIVLLIKHMPETVTAENAEKIHLKKIFCDYFGIMKHPQFMLNILSVCLVFSGIIAWLVAGPYLIVNRYHLPPLYFGLAQILVFGGFIIGTRIVKKLVHSFTLEKIAGVGFITVLVGSILGVLVCFVLNNLMVYLISLTVFALGAGLSFSPLQRIGVESAATFPMGSRMAVFSTLMGGFGILSSLLVTLYYNGELISLSLIILAPTVLALVLKRVVLPRFG